MSWKSWNGCALTLASFIAGGWWPRGRWRNCERGWRQDRRGFRRPALSWERSLLWNRYSCSPWADRAPKIRNCLGWVRFDEDGRAEDDRGDCAGQAERGSASPSATGGGC